MSDKMPESMDEEAVADWMDDRDEYGDRSVSSYVPLARAVLDFVRAKVREAARMARQEYAPLADNDECAINGTVARVMGTEARPGREDAGNRNASAPDVREAAERVRAEREYRDKTAMCDNYTDHARSRQRESEAVEDLLRAALAAPVSPPAAAKRERRTVWFMENSAGLWMRADFCENTQDPNEARWFSTRESCEAACDTVRRNGPHPGVRVYRPTEHIFFGDDEVPVSPPAPRGEAVALGWTMLRADGMPTGVMSCERGKVERICDEHNRDEVAGFPFRVVALVPKEAP